MRVEEDQIFNLMDTNGRRNDVVDALLGYLSILDDVLRKQKLTWDALPASTAEFEFYRQAVALSPDVFQKHAKYDALMAQLDEWTELKTAIAQRDLSWLAAYYGSCSRQWRNGVDKDVEARARHYTSTLVKLGFADDERRITDPGDVLLGRLLLRRDSMEALLPLNDTNIVYLRQLLKLRIFDSGGRRYYAPFCMALYVLLRKERVSQAAFRAMVQGISPYQTIGDYDAFIEQCEKNESMPDDSFCAPDEIDCPYEISRFDFERVFRNRKSGKAAEVYYRFYQALLKYYRTESKEALRQLLILYETHRDMLNKAFGCGNSLFQNKTGHEVSDFLGITKREPIVQSFDILETYWTGDEGREIEEMRRFNTMLYQRFRRSKMMDSIREYWDTTRRIFKASGLISFENGYVELVCRDLCGHVFDSEAVKSRIVGDMAAEIDSVPPLWNLNHTFGQSYDAEYDRCVFFRNYSVREILHYSDKKIDETLNAVRTAFDGAPLDEISRIVQRRRRTDFEKMIASRYPRERVKDLLGLFSDRSNDTVIKKEVYPDASVPTIYEFMVGLAWYYFSNETIDLLRSLNLTLSADFEPLTHAGGGMGDIVIQEPDSVVMLEATLMNANSQKRGEWEPVLRHAVNLKIEAESAGRQEVTTFFIADAFDANTVNIWKAVSSVPLQSSVDKSKYTDSVIIMPVSNHELVRLMDRGSEYHQIIQQVRSLFLKDIQKFNRDWREDFIRQL